MYVCPSVYPSVHLSKDLSVRVERLGSTERIFMKFGIWKFLETLSRKFKFH
jgi:hypothetical protein